MCTVGFDSGVHHCSKIGSKFVSCKFWDSSWFLVGTPRLELVMAADDSCSAHTKNMTMMGN